MTIASRRVPCARRPIATDEPLVLSDFVVARYVDREINNARTTAEQCAALASEARSGGRHLVAGALHDFASEFIDEAALLAPAARPDATWPWPDEEQPVAHDLDDAISAFNESLQHSEHALQWIASRPDLPPSAAVAFASLASARRARRRLLLACNEIDRL
jgi:hypothetical protein